jgi:hypothetical protein
MTFAGALLRSVRGDEIAVLAYRIRFGQQNFVQTGTTVEGLRA